VDRHGTIISFRQLPHYFSVFAAEAIAILKAIKHALEHKGKHVICSDSLSTLHGVENLYNKDSLLCEIRHHCIQNRSKIKLFWVPGHMDIEGNDLADNAAKLAGRSPTITVIPGVQLDIRRNIENVLNAIEKEDWQSYHHWYKLSNPHNSRIRYPASCNRSTCSVLTWLRIGHTDLTHKHILKGKDKLNCPGCGGDLTIKHILDECSQFNKIRSDLFNQTLPSNLITNPSTQNINKIILFLKKCNLRNKI